MIYLTLPEMLHIAERVLGSVELRDAGLLESAVARPRTTVLGSEAYPRLTDKGAALTHSVARNHALVDGNKRLALAALIAFLGMNGWRLTMTNDEAYDFVVAIATGQLNDVGPIADVLDRFVEPRG